MRSLLAFPVLALLLASCDTLAGPRSDDGPVRAAGVSLDADRTRYDNRDEVRLTLRNDGAATYTTGVLECAELERWDGTAWVPSRMRDDRACIAIGLFLEPGQTIDGTPRLNVPAGSYRFTVSLAESVRVATAALRVE